MSHVRVPLKLEGFLKILEGFWSSVENESQMANFAPMVGSESMYCKENIDKASTCHIERRETKRVEREVAIMAQ
jgi:hypothetical protein